MPTLAEIVSTNVNRVRIEHDLSTRELASRCNMPQKTVHSVMTLAHVPKLDTIDQLCRAMFIQPQAVVTESMPLNMLMSRRIGRLINSYKTLTPDQRDQVEALVESFNTKREIIQPQPVQYEEAVYRTQ